MTTDFRSEAIGSLLRPKYLMDARASSESGTLSPARFKSIEDRAVDEALAKIAARRIEYCGPVMAAGGVSG